MQGKKRYLALILFIIIGLVTFSFANPEDQLEPVGDAVKKVDDSTELKEEKTEAEKAVDEAELLPSIETVEDAMTIIQNTVTDVPKKETLVNRVEEAKKAIDTSELVATVEKMVEEATNKDDITASENYFIQNNIENLTGNMEPGAVKDNLEERIEYLNTIFNDSEAPEISGIENGEVTKNNVSIVIKDSTKVTTTVTLNNNTIDFADEFTKEGVYVINVIDEAHHTNSLTFTIDKTNPKFEGLSSREAHIEKYVVDVTDATETKITLQKDHGEFIEIAEGYVIDAEGTYQLVGLDAAGNKYTTWIIIDKTYPTITGVTNGSVVNKCENVYVFDRYLKTVDINGTVYTRADFTHDVKNENFKFSPEKICTAGKYTITATDMSGKTYTETFTIDRTAPKKVSADFYVDGVTGIKEVIDSLEYTVFYTKGDKVVRATVAMDEQLREFPTFKFYNNGIAYEPTTTSTSYDEVNKKWYYHATLNVPTEMAEGEITYFVTNLYDKAGNAAESIEGPTNSRKVILDKTTAKRLSTDFYVHGVTQIGKMFYTQSGKKVTVNIKTNEPLGSIPTFTLHTLGKDIVLTDVLDRGQDSNGKWLYQGSYLLENIVDGEITFTISNIVDRAGNSTADIKDATNGRRVILDNTPNRITQSFYRGSDVDGLNYYLTNGNKIQFNIGFREMLGEAADITIGGKTVELIYDKYYVATNSHMYYGYLEAAENETELVPGELAIEIKNITDYAGNKGFYYQTNGKQVLETIKTTNTTNFNVAVYKLIGSPISTPEELKELFSDFNNIKDKVVYLTKDIDMSGVTDWSPVMGVDGYSFTLEGNGHKISNLVYETNKNYAGLFFEGMDSGNVTIKNLTIENSKVTSTASGSYVGLIGGYIDVINSVTLNNVNIINSEVNSTNYAGAFLGWTAGYNNVNNGPVDGIVNIIDCTVKGTKVFGGGSAGLATGHAGTNAGTYTTIKNFVAEGNTVKGEKAEKTGAIIGTANSGIVVLDNIEYKNNTVFDVENSTKLIGRFVPNSTGQLTHIVDDETEFADAITNALSGQVIKLGKDLSYSDKTMTFAKDKNVVVDLNEKQIYARSTEKKAFNFLTVKTGAKVTLTGNGTILYEAGNPDTDWGVDGSKPYPGYANNTIRNEGNLIVDGVTIKNNTAKGGASYVIDNYAGADLVVKSGNIHQTGGDIAIRLFSGSATTATKVTIDGGTITGHRAIWAQLPSSDSKVAPKTEVTVNGGELNTSTENGLAFYSYSYGNSYANTIYNFAGGTWNGNVHFGGGYKGDREKVNITGGTFNGELGRWITPEDFEDIAKP